MADLCPICGFLLPGEKKKKQSKSGDFQLLFCDLCGEFKISRSNFDDLHQDEKYKSDEEKKAIVSHTIQKMQSNTEIPFIVDDWIERILQNSLPDLPEQKNNFIQWIGEGTKPGKSMPIQIHPGQSIIGAESEEGFKFVVDHLFFLELVEGERKFFNDGRGIPDLKLSFRGWELYDQMKRGEMDIHKAFMAMKYKEPELDDIVDNHFRHAVAQTGFKLYKLTDEPKFGIIDNHLRNEIRTSRFLIADLSHDNQGAYWEAGFAEGLGKQVIFTCEKEKFEKPREKNGGTHFDTNHCTTIMWDKKQPEIAAQELKVTIRATFPDEAQLTDD